MDATQEHDPRPGIARVAEGLKNGSHFAQALPQRLVPRGFLALVTGFARRQTK
jgi:hypothetical protein